MKLTFTAALAASMLTLAACGGQGDDALGDNIADAAEAKSDRLDQAADNAATDAQEDQLEQQADTTERMGEAMEEAVDEADVVVNQQ